jgi:hypothetical protein
MVFSINALTTGDKRMSDFKQLAIGTNGTALKPGPLQNVAAGAAAAPTTVTVQAGAGGGGAVATGTGAAALATATVVAGQGQDATGNVCSCSCLCGVNSFPASAAIANFGGFPGLM